MDMVDRIMKAFVQQRPLTTEQEAIVRAEIALFAQGLLNDDKSVLSARQSPIGKLD